MHDEHYPFMINETFVLRLQWVTINKWGTAIMHFRYEDQIWDENKREQQSDLT